MQSKADHIEFQKEIGSRGINHLIHFTPTINLLSIYEQGGLLSRALLEKFDIDQTDIFDYVEFTDPIRFDDKNYINLSVQHPNSFLFKRFVQKTSENMYVKWCVIKIDPKYIFQNDTLFSITNAANSHNKRNVGVTGDLYKFRMMFSEEITVVTSYGSKQIRRAGLKSMYPTDEQAEVLVKGEIPVSDFISICFKDENDMAEAKAAMIGMPCANFIVEPGLFESVRK